MIAFAISVSTRKTSVNLRSYVSAQSREYLPSHRRRGRHSSGLKRNPVTFRYKKEFDATGIPQFGLVAEEVAKVNPDLVLLDRDGKPYTVRYEEINAMLLNEFLKEHKKVEEQQANISLLNSKVANQAAIIAQQQKEMEVFIAQLKSRPRKFKK